MSIHFISGKPGGGKTLYSMKLIIEELVYGFRMIITNVPINLGALAEFLHREYPGKVIDVGSRVWILTDEQTAEFWTYRPGCRIPRLNQADWMHGVKPSYADVKDKGVMYVIDELHNFFGARQWAETGRDVLFYLSQHRKLGDTFIGITQAIANVDKQFRSVTQDFTYIRNLSKERLGWFRLPAYFVRKTFSSPATDTSQPMESGTFKLDVSGLAACYDTAAGVGIHGRGADRTERKKGAHWAFAVVALIAGSVALFYGIPAIGGAIFHTDVKRLITAPPVRQTNTNLPPPSSQAPVVKTSYNQSWREISPVPAGNSTNVVKMTGCAQFGSAYYATLSDGRVLSSKDVRWQGLTSQWVQFGGVRYYAIEGF